MGSASSPSLYALPTLRRYASMSPRARNASQYAPPVVGLSAIFDMSS